MMMSLYTHSDLSDTYMNKFTQPSENFQHRQLTATIALMKNNLKMLLMRESKQAGETDLYIDVVGLQLANLWAAFSCSLKKRSACSEADALQHNRIISLQDAYAVSDHCQDVACVDTR